MLKPILFNTEMVRAIQEGRKTATRRIVKPNTSWGLELLGGQDTRLTSDDVELICDPPCAVGDVLWVREAWAFWPCVVCHSECECCEIAPDPPDKMETADGLTDGCFLYRADGDMPDGYKWSPSIHMPKQAARIFLRVTEVFPERLWEIDEAGAIAEGLYKGWKQTEEMTPAGSARQAFMWLWQHLTRKGPVVQSWAANPWVWVIRFERCERPEGWPEA